MTDPTTARRGLTYSRFVADNAPPGALHQTEAHVRAHLSAVADRDDDPDTRADDVELRHERYEAGVLIVGFLPGGRAQAPYLEPGHDPFAGVDPALVEEVLGGQD